MKKQPVTLNCDVGVGKTGLRLALGGLMALLAAAVGQAANVSLTASDSSGTSTSFNSAGNWDDLSAPGSGNDYFTGAFNILTPNTTSDYGFGGASLTVESGGALVYGGGKGTNNITVSNLILDGGTIQNSGTNSTADFHLKGVLNVSAGGTISGSYKTAIDSAVSGSGALVITLGTGVTFTSGSNTFTGDISLQGSGVLVQASTANFNFTIGADGVNNSIYGTGTQTATLDGSFDFDLSGAATSPGSSWTIVDTSSIVATFATNFTVTGFTDNGSGLWTDGTYQFDTSSGVLSVAAIPETASYAVIFGALAGLVAVRRRMRRA